MKENKYLYESSKLHLLQTHGFQLNVNQENIHRLAYQFH